jgi:predicted DsbA family dithiol-disulfide isomerase
MAESGLDSLRNTYELAVVWRAFELLPPDVTVPPEVETAHRAYVAETWPRVQQIARDRFGLELRRDLNAGRRSTHLAHTGAKFALARGAGEAYQRAMFRAVWHELRDISLPDTLAKIAKSVGLDEAEYRAALMDEQYRTQVEADMQWAVEHGLTGVPAFIFGSRYLVVGAQPTEALQQVAERCVQEGRTV